MTEIVDPGPRYAIECYGATRAQVGHRANEDAFVIEREPIFHAAVFDGAGNAELAAHRAADFFKALVKDQAGKVGDPQIWCGWVRLLDSHLMGGGQSTFVGVAAPSLGENLIVGARAGDSRAYVVGDDGVKLVSDENPPARLGTGRAAAKTFSVRLRQYDILLLMSDGAWVPLGSDYSMRRAAMSGLSRHFSEVPGEILDAGMPRDGPGDDMTVVALRMRRMGVFRREP